MSVDLSAAGGWTRNGFLERVRVVRSLLESLDLPRGFRLLDGGCGVGAYLEPVSTLQGMTVGLDRSASALAAVRRKDCSLVRATVERLPFRDRSFDVVLSIGVLQTLRAPRALFREAARVLKPGGYLVVTGLHASLRRALVRGDSSRKPYRLPEILAWADESSLRAVRTGYLYVLPGALHVATRPLNRVGWINRRFRVLAGAFFVVLRGLDAPRGPGDG